MGGREGERESVRFNCPYSDIIDMDKSINKRDLF